MQLFVKLVDPVDSVNRLLPTHYVLTKIIKVKRHRPRWFYLLITPLPIKPLQNSVPFANANRDLIQNIWRIRLLIFIVHFVRELHPDEEVEGDRDQTWDDE